MVVAPVVAFGELLLRLSAPARAPLLQAAALDAWFGGAEANVAVALARLGTPARFVSAVPANALGTAGCAELRRAGVDIAGVRQAPGRLGLYFVAPGAGPRASEVVYDRAGSVFAGGDAGYDWAAALDGAAWLHLSGVTLAVSAAAERAAWTAVEAAHAAGVPVSFDCNFRARLWEARGDDPAPVIARFVAAADLTFANHRDATLLAGEAIAPDDAAAWFFARFPRLQRLAHVTRDVASHERHRLTGTLAARDDDKVTSRTWTLDAIVDRIGGGDAFAAGLLHALSHARAPQDAIDFATATGVLKHTLPGDMFALGEDDVQRLRDGGGDIQR